jgi:hypothetical protein
MVGQGVVVELPLRERVRPAKPVRVAFDVHAPLAQVVAPLRDAIAPRGPVVVLCDVHAPPAQLAVPWCVDVRPDADVLLDDVLQLLSAQVVVPLWTPPRAPVDDVVRVTAPASRATRNSAASKVDRTSACFMRTSGGG